MKWNEKKAQKQCTFRPLICNNNYMSQGKGRIVQKYGRDKRYPNKTKNGIRSLTFSIYRKQAQCVKDLNVHKKKERNL